MSSTDLYFHPYIHGKHQFDLLVKLWIMFFPLQFER